jgi:hypothetical protein
MNQIVEQYLRIYCNHQQDNWSHLLSVAEFAINNSFQASLKCSPFYANYGYHPTFSIDVRKSSLSVPAAKTLAESLRNIHDHLADNLKYAQNTQAHYYDAQHQRIEFCPGDKVWLLSTNIKTQRPSKKLDWKRLGPFEIIEKIGLQAYKLRLPASMKIHNVFHVSLLEPYHESTIPNRIRPLPPPIVVDTHEEFEVEDILDSKRSYGALWYLVKWKGYPISENSWEPATNVKNARRLVKAYHDKYPRKPH